MLMQIMAYLKRADNITLGKKTRNHSLDQNMKFFQSKI